MLCGPDPLLPATAHALAPGVAPARDMDEAIDGADVVMMLRVQKERLAGLEIETGEYIAPLPTDGAARLRQGQEGCAGHASRADDPRHGDDRRGRRLRAIGGAPSRWPTG